MKKNRSLNLNIRLFCLGTILSIGFVGTFLLNNFLKGFYNSSKSNLEQKIGKVLNKKVDLGDYSGIRFLGISLANPKIIDNENINSGIKAQNMYVGIMPFKSFLNQKWMIKINPKKTEITVDKEFFKRDITSSNDKNNKKAKNNYVFNLYLTKYSSLKLKDVGLETKIKGYLIYNSKNRNIIGNVKSNFEGKGKLRLKLNTKLNQDIIRLGLFSKGINLGGTDYNYDSKRYYLSKGKFKSNFKFYKSRTKTSCSGGFSLKNLILNTSNLVENINSSLVNFYCRDNVLKANTKNLNYGTLTSEFNLDIPLNNNINNINFDGNIGYLNSLNPDIKLSGNIPYWLDKRGINFGNLDSAFDLNRTQLSNLNVFRINGVRGFVTAKGKLKGKINDPDILINFNLDYPHYKGIRVREIWEGEIKNENKYFLLNMKNRYSPIPSFLSVTFDSNIRLDNLIFSRIFNSNKGSLLVTKDNNNFIWNVNNFPLDELELSISNNQFDRISGIINGSGIISTNQSFFDGRIALSLGKYRNIKFANSLFDFTVEDDNFFVNSSLYPIDGGMIEVEYDSNKRNIFNMTFNNISTSWSILTAIDILNFNNREKDIPVGKTKVLKDLEIRKDDMSFKERIKFINNFVDEKFILEDKYNIKRYLNKFKSRYDAQLEIEGDSQINYKLRTKLNGYLDVLNYEVKKNRKAFSIDLEGGLLKGQGSLKVKDLPLEIINIFLDEPKDFKGGFDINLSYDLDNKSFLSQIYTKKTFIKNDQIKLEKGKINYDKSIFDIDLSLTLNDSILPISIDGFIPLNNKENIDLRLVGNGKFIKLVDILADDYFTFNAGDVNLRMIVKGKLSKPIINGFIVIKDSEVNVLSTIIKNINSVIIFDFDNLEVKNLQASGKDFGNIFLEGSLPFYDKNNSSDQDIELVTKKFNIETSNSQFLVDSNISISGSFEKPILEGNLALNNGYINFNSSNKNKKNSKNVNEKNYERNWPELEWENDKKIEIISNETILNSVLLGERLPKYLENLSFNNFKLKLGPDFKLQYSEIIKAYLDTKLDLNINGTIGEDLNARGLIYLKKGRANLYTTPFKLDKNKENYILFASRSGVVPFINFSLISKVPDSIIPIRENNQDTNIANDLNTDVDSSGLGTFGIGNTRLIKIEASYEGFLDQLSFEDENQRIQLRSTPSYNRSQIIGLIGGNSANLINRAFISQFNSADAFSERFQLSLYPVIIENNDSLNNVFTNENLDIQKNEESPSNEDFSSQAWVAEIGLDITDTINFAVQTIPGRDDLPPLGILTFQANPNLELLGSLDSDGDWKSQVQLFFRY